MKNVKREFESFKVFLSDQQNRRTVLLIIVSMLVLMLIIWLKDSFSGTKYIASENGNVVGVIRDDPGEYASFPLEIEAEKDGEKRKKEVTLTIEAAGEDDEDDASVETDTRTIFDAEVSELLSKLSKSDGRRIMLPVSLSDGTKLIWKRGKDTGKVLIVFMAPFLIWLLYLNGEKKKRDLKKMKSDSVRRDLPGFNDHLLLMLKSGLIFREAFGRIAGAYKSKPKNSYFEEQIIAIEDETSEGVSDIVNVISRRADEMGISEFSRLVGIIRDSQLLGVNISGKLFTESRVLWDLRKRNAEERGRAAETKLTAPLALMLIVLVLVTAAPAIIQVNS